MRVIGAVTTSRADFGIYLPILHRIIDDPGLSLHLIASGTHLSPEFGLTVKQIEAEGLPVSERIETLLSSDTPEGVSKSIGLGVLGFAQSFSQFRPDILIVLGDRFEMYASALAALPFRIPVAHIHGGEVTWGAIDDALRHSLTKLSHLHFVSTESYRHRVIQLGEDPWRVVVSGAPSLDNVANTQLLTLAEIESCYGLKVKRPFLLVTFHPVTLEYEQTERQVDELLIALKQVGLPVVFTTPNADTNGRVIAQKLKEFAAMLPEVQYVDNLGTVGYFSLMAYAECMVGNSSSGIIEALSFELPVVNIGTRQAGRTQGINVINASYEHQGIASAISRALVPTFRQSLRGVPNPYGKGQAAEIIVSHLRQVSLDDHLIIKKFYDLPQAHEPGLMPCED